MFIYRNFAAIIPGCYLDMSTLQQNSTTESVKDVSAPTTAENALFKHVDYKSKHGGSLAAHFIFECAIKLNIKPLTSATAAVVFHRFFREVESDVYDEFVCSRLGAFILEAEIEFPTLINQSIFHT